MTQADTFARSDDPLRTSLATVVLIRWLAIAGQTTTVLIVELTIGGLDLLPVLGAIGASVLLNTAVSLDNSGFRRLDHRGAAWHIAFDVIQLGALLALTGGPQNPFRIFILGPVALAAATLSGRQAALIAGLSVSLMTSVTLWHRPLPWSEAVVFPPFYTFGTWVALCVGIVSISFFTWQMATERRRMDAAYEASRTALLEEQRVAAVGGLAAMVAHELNTPLGTVCLLAREVACQMPEDSPFFEDLQMLTQQAERCRDILARLSRRREYDALVDEETVAFSTLVEMAAAPHRLPQVEVAFAVLPPAEGAARTEPWTVRSPEILHGLGNLMQNAIQFARARVDVAVQWDDSLISVRIGDDGPGFAERLLEDLGEPYLSTRDQDGTHLGLGIFIATTLLRRTGGQVAFANRPTGGGEVTITWRRADLVPPVMTEVAHA